MSSEHRKLLVAFFVMSVRVQNKNIGAFVEERKVFSLLIVKYPLRNDGTNYELKKKTVQNKFVKEISFQKIGF